MCCCCCPPAVTALLCLWVRSGFSKGSVAGALTFFPPNPAFYKFQRCSTTGEELPDDDDKDSTREDNEVDGESEKSDIDDLQLDAERSTDVSTSDPSSSSSFRENKSRKKKTTKKSSNSNNAKDTSLSDRTRKLMEKSKRRYEKDSRDAAIGVTYKFVPDARIPKPRFDGTISCCKLYNSKAKSYIATVVYRVRNPEYSSPVKTLIYSHGNATDIGAMSYIQAILAKNLKVNIVMYDYSGYGESGGMPLENNTYSDIETVYDYVMSYIADRKPDNIVVYGQSVGSGPSCYIANKRPVGGLILHSPFTSGMRVLTPSRALACLDIYPNIDRIKRVKCPVFIIHGVQDEEVDIGHGHSLYEAVDPVFRRDPWWVPDRGHNDITEGPGKMAEYIRRLRVFFESLENEGINSSATDNDGIETKLVKKGVMIR